MSELSVYELEVEYTEVLPEREALGSFVFSGNFASKSNNLSANDVSILSLNGNNIS